MLNRDRPFYNCSPPPTIHSRVAEAMTFFEKVIYEATTKKFAVKLESYSHVRDRFFMSTICWPVICSNGRLLIAGTAGMRF
jgi:hypothetical protein